MAHATINCTIEITDVNDVTPKFSKATYFVSVKNNTQKGTGILNVTATDGDVSPEFNTLTYSIKSLPQLKMIVLHLGTLRRCSFNKFMNLSHCRSITSWSNGNSWNWESCGVLNKHTQIERDPLIGRTHRLGWKVSQTRFLHKWDRKLPSKKKFLQDDVPGNYDLICDTVIYRPYLFWLLPFTFVWSSTMAMVAMVVTVAAIFIVYNYPENFPEKIGGIKTMYAIAGTTISILLCLSVFQTIHMRRKIVDRLYYNRNTGDFIAISKKGSDKKWNFKSHEVLGKEDVGWKGNFVIKGRHCVVLPEGFSKIGTIKFYNKWCGIE